MFRNLFAVFATLTLGTGAASASYRRKSPDQGALKAERGPPEGAPKLLEPADVLAQTATGEVPRLPTDGVAAAHDNDDVGEVGNVR